MKYNYILLIFTFLTSCVVNSNAHIIAYNHDKSIVLTEDSLRQWLSMNIPAQYQDLAYQIDSFFLEKALLQQQKILPIEKLKEIEFKHKKILYRSAFPIYKKEVISKIQIDQKQYNLLLDDLKQKNKIKKDKVRLYQIYKKYPADINSQLKQQYFKSMQEIRNSISDLESFKKVAQVESDSQSRLRNGLVGNVHHGLFPQKLNDIVMNMKVGEFSDIIKTTNGLMLFYCESHIPAHIFTNKEMEKTVKNTILGYEKKVHWSQFKNNIVDDLNIRIDWSKISSGNSLQKIATSKFSNLSQQEIEWVINKKGFNKLDENNVTDSLNNYFVSQFLYNNLNDGQQKILIKKNKQLFVNQVTSEVLFELIHSSFKAPSENMLNQYFIQNNKNYMRPEHYDISFIAVKTTKDNKIEAYNKANTVLNKLKLNPENFGQLSKQYSVKSKNRVKSISKIKLASFFGIDVSKQIHRLDLNEISKIVESDNGLLWIIQLNNIEKKRQMTFDEARKIIDKKLGNDMLEQIKQETLSKTISQQGITIISKNETLKKTVN